MLTSCDRVNVFGERCNLYISPFWRGHPTRAAGRWLPYRVHRAQVGETEGLHLCSYKNLDGGAVEPLPSWAPDLLPKRPAAHDLSHLVVGKDYEVERLGLA